MSVAHFFRKSATRFLWDKINLLEIKTNIKIFQIIFGSINNVYFSCPNPNLAEKCNLVDQLHKSQRNVQLVNLVAQIQN